MTLRLDLTVEIRSRDGSSNEFYQAQEENIARTLQLLRRAPAVSEPQLVLASEQGVSLIPCAGTVVIIGLIMAGEELVDAVQNADHLRVPKQFRTSTFRMHEIPTCLNQCSSNRLSLILNSLPVVQVRGTAAA